MPRMLRLLLLQLRWTTMLCYSYCSHRRHRWHLDGISPFKHTALLTPCIRRETGFTRVTTLLRYPSIRFIIACWKRTELTSYVRLPVDRRHSKEIVAPPVAGSERKGDFYFVFVAVVSWGKQFPTLPLVLWAYCHAAAMVIRSIGGATEA